MASTQADIPIIKAKDNFGADYLYIATTKRKAWNMLLKDGGIVCLNKRYIEHKGIVWHNNRLIPSLICTDGFKEVIDHTDLLQGRV